MMIAKEATGESTNWGARKYGMVQFTEIFALKGLPHPSISQTTPTPLSPTQAKSPNELVGKAV
jgi:hypothetical protein